MIASPVGDLCVPVQVLADPATAAADQVALVDMINHRAHFECGDFRQGGRVG